MDFLYPSHFPHCTHQEKRATKWYATFENWTDFFFLPFALFSPFINPSVVFNTMQNIRKMKPEKKSCFKKSQMKSGSFMISFWFLFWLWLGSWITGITWKKNEILKLQYQHLKICPSQRLKLTRCMLCPPVHNIVQHSYPFSASVYICKIHIIESYLNCSHNKTNRISHVTGTWLNCHEKQDCLLFGLGFFQVV